MQVITTEAYFDGVEAPAGLAVPARLGLGLAWIDTAGTVLDPSDLSGLDLFGEDSFPLARLSVGDVHLEGAPRVFAELVNAALWNCPLDRVGAHAGMNAAIVVAVRRVSVMVAPSRGVPLIDLLGRDRTRIVGTLLGWTHSAHRPWLALVARPQGLLLIGSALALAEALALGLERALVRLVNEKRASGRRSWPSIPVR